MGVRVIVREDESIEQALRRFQSCVRRQGYPSPICRARWHKPQIHYYLKPSVLNRRKRLLAKNETFRGECARRRLVALRRLSKHRRLRFPV